MPAADTYQCELQQLADEAAALQARVNLQIGWAMIASLPISPNLYDANAKLVEVARHLHEIARQAVEDAAFSQGVRQTDRVAAFDGA